MAYFNHAFVKSFVVDSVDVTGGTATSALTPGEFSLVEVSSAHNWVTTIAPSVPSLVYLVQGSYHTKDNIGNNPGHGGYSESVKSKAINPRYVTRIWESECCTASPAYACVALASNCAPCGTSLFLRLDVKGAPALRFLNRNSYAIGDSGNICCADGQSYLDPALVIATIGKMLLSDPLISPFAIEQTGGGVTIAATALNAVTVVGTLVGGTGYTNGTYVIATTGGTGTGLTLLVTVAGGIVTGVGVSCPGSGYTVADIITLTGGALNATVTVNTVAQTAVYTIADVVAGTYAASLDPVADGVTATLCFQGAYVDTRFGDCSFDTRDYYGKEPVQLIASMLDETGNPCNTCGVVTRTPGTMQQTSGETVLRDIIMTENYMKSPYNQGNPDSARIREIEGSNEILAAVDRTTLYKTYYVQHSIPRLNNPTGTFDNDQYIYQIYVKCSDSTNQTKIETLLDALVDAATASGNPLVRELSTDACVAGR